MPKLWSAPVELSSLEERIASRCRKRKIFVFLRAHRHELFDAEFQAQLWSMYSEHERGRARVHPVLLCLASLLQAALDVPDHEAVELTLDSRRWRMVLNHHDDDRPAFSQGTLFNFRERMIEREMDKVLFERTVTLARGTGGFGAKRLRAAFDASPLWGAGRVEDTFNLIPPFATWSTAPRRSTWSRRRPRAPARPCSPMSPTSSPSAAPWTRRRCLAGRRRSARRSPRCSSAARRWYSSTTSIAPSTQVRSPPR